MVRFARVFPWIAVMVVLLGPARTAVPDERADGKPPLLLDVLIDGRPHRIEDGAETVAEIGGRPVEFGVRVLPVRVFHNTEGLAFPYPSDFTFRYEKEPKSERRGLRESWALLGARCMIRIEKRHEARRDAADVTVSWEKYFREKYSEEKYPNAALSLETTVILGGKRLPGYHQEVRQPGGRMEDQVAFDGPGGTLFTLYVLRDFDEEGRPSTQADQAMGLLERVFHPFGPVPEGTEVRPAEEVPPLRLALDIAGRTYGAEAGRAVVVPVDGRSIPVTVTVLDVRVFKKAEGLRFRYPSGFRYEEMRPDKRWLLMGSGYTMILTRDGTSGLSAARLTSVRERFWKRKYPKASLATGTFLSLGGRAMEGLHVEGSGPRGRVTWNDYIAFDGVGQAYSLTITRMIDEQGRPSADAERALALMDAEFRFPARPPAGSRPAAEDPPLLLGLTVDGREYAVKPDGMSMVEVGDRSIAMSLALLPMRIFNNVDGIRFAYPRDFRFAYQEDKWKLSGKGCRISFSKHDRILGPAKRVSAVLGFWRKTWPKAKTRSESPLRLNGETLPSAHLERPEKRFVQDLLAFGGPQGVYTLSVFRFPDAGGRFSAPAEEAVRLLASGLRGPAEEVRAAEEEPPLLLRLGVGARTEDLPAGREVVLEVGARQIRVVGTVRPVRIFDNVDGIRFPFPRKFRLRYEDSGARENWELSGPGCLLSLSKHRLPGRREAPAYLASLTAAGWRKRFPNGRIVGDRLLPLGGTAVKALRLETPGDGGVFQDYVAFEGAEGVYSLSIVQSHDADGRVGPAARDAMRLLADEFRFPAK